MTHKYSRSEYSPLCCCEYYDRHGERNHLAALCCNCQDLDEAFERCITCRKVPGKVLQGIWSVIQDRMRLPWPGGAVEIPLEFLVPFLIVPATMVLCTIGPFATAFFFTLTCFSLWYYHKVYKAGSLFWPGLILASILTECLIFQLEVVPFMEILPVENCILIVMLTVGLTSLALTLYHARFASSLRSVDPINDVSTGEAGSNCAPAVYCRYCKDYIKSPRLHCIWLSCCITPSNCNWLCVGTIMCALACLYGADLSLTTICHPRVTFLGKWLLVPDNCDDVYGDFELAICFVSAVYNLLLGFVLVIVFVRLVALNRRYKRLKKNVQNIESM